jgi:hypothetical protein
MLHTVVEPRRRTSGFSAAELAVCIALIAVFAGLLLERLLYYQEAAEKAVMELEANTLKLALQVHVGDLIARNQAVDYPQLARENPVAWMDRPPVGYRGEFDGDVSSQLPKGSWYFDRASAEVVYVVNLDRNFGPGSVGRTRVRWRVKLVRPEGVAAKDSVAIGMRLVPVEPYHWF